jgi:predicted dehydrogenase
MDNNQPINVGVIGAGERGVYTIGARMAERVKTEKFIIRALSDINEQRLKEAKQFLELRYKENSVDLDISIYNNYMDLINDPNVDLIMITTFTARHLESAIPALKSKKKVYLDKPIATKLEDSYKIIQTEQSENNPFIMGFTRRYETSWRKAYEILQSGKIGDLQMILLRSVIPYARYLQRWHKNQDLSGGALNDKASHHFDVFNWFAGSRPKLIQAVGGRSNVFTPDDNAPERCRYCDRVCPYRIVPSDSVKEIGVYYTLEKEYVGNKASIFTQDSWYNSRDKFEIADGCVYNSEVNIFDHAVANVEYENGIKATEFITIFGPVSDDQETLELVGSSGRIKLIRNTGDLDIVSNYGAVREIITTADNNITSSHNGADIGLLKDMRGFFFGGKPVADSHDGHLSLRMVHAVDMAIKQGGATIQLSGVPYGDL